MKLPLLIACFYSLCALGQINENNDSESTKSALQLLYEQNSDLANYIGTYEVKIIIYEGQKLPYPYNGKLYVTDAGVSLISDMPVHGTIRGNHSNEEFLIKNMQSRPGSFFGSLSKGLGQDYSLVINKTKTSGAMTLSQNRQTTTISFVIQQK